VLCQFADIRLDSRHRCANLFISAVTALFQVVMCQLTGKAGFPVVMRHAAGDKAEFRYRSDVLAD
jgi:hypothetical protein